MSIVLSFSSLCILLVLGKFARVKIKLLQKLYLPSSVIGGIIGLIIIQLAGSKAVSDFIQGWVKLPGFLINIVFAALFLGVTIPSISVIWKRAGPQLAYGQIVVWGQYLVGMILVLLILKRVFGIPDLFGVIIPVGFEGGHGTAAGLRETFEYLSWREGTDYCLSSATLGIISAIVIGIILINWAARKGYLEVLQKKDVVSLKNNTGLYAVEERPSAGNQTTSADSIDSLAFHLSIIGIAVLIGVCLKFGLMKTSKINPVDHTLMQRIGGTALDFLVVAAISTIHLQVIFSNIIPFMLIILSGIVWNVFCLIWLARRLLPNCWFERAIAEMGQSMGVTATGLLLLRIVDPEHKTVAISAFGYKQLLHEPFMGGGIWTSTAILLVAGYGGWIVLAISATAIVIWLMVWR
ncbi:MAG: sodium/glutamate symporter, partial [bacterium]